MKKLIILCLCFLFVGCAKTEEKTAYKTNDLKNTNISEAIKQVDSKIENIKIIFYKDAKITVENKEYEIKKKDNYSYVEIPVLDKGIYDIKVDTDVFQNFNVKLNIDTSNFEYDIRKEIINNKKIKPDVYDDIEKNIDSIMNKLFDFAVNNASYEDVKDLYSSSLSKNEVQKSMSDFKEILDFNRDKIKKFTYKKVTLKDKYELVNNCSLTISGEIFWSYEPDISERLELRTTDKINITVEYLDSGNIKLIDITD